MKRLEILAILAAIAIIVGTPAATFGYEAFLRSLNPNEITLIAGAPENGGWSPSTIRVKQGDAVKLRLRSDDVTHGLAIPAFGVDFRHIYPGKFATVEFVADKAGTFPFFCSVLCSPNHGKMSGQLIVEAQPGQAAVAPKADAPKADSPKAGAPKTEAPKVEATKDETAPGKQVYQSFCAACHGANAEGGLGPPLAGRTKEQIVTKVRESKGPMPAFSPQQLGDADLDKLVKFVESLGKR